ncbi:MAG TPA: acyl carrier protein [Thermoleophilaceae bacterium]|nr:acyl carrier protein [Thermoleophilaceae bacterium]
MRDQVREVVGQVFGLSPADIADDASIETVEGWDSLHHMELMLELEMRFGVQMTTDVMPTLISIPAIEEYLQEQGAGPRA